MAVTITTAENSFSVDGVWYRKGALTFEEATNNRIVIRGYVYQANEVICDGVSFSTLPELVTWLNASLFSAGGGDGEGVTWLDTSMLPVPGKIPIWSEQGLLSTGEPLFPENAVNLVYLQTLTGWAIYNDSILTSASPLVSTVGNRVKITNSANSIINDQLPLGVTSFWNNTTNKVTPDSIGDSYNINLRFIAISTSNQGLADVEVDVGGSLGIISGTTLSMRKGIGAEQKFNLNFDVYSGSTFITNGGEFYIKSIDGDTSIHDIRLKITRVHKGR